MAKHDNTHKLNTGELKNVDRVLNNRDTITGRRKVRVNHTTWIYTRFATDAEAIANYNRIHEIIVDK